MENNNQEVQMAVNAAMAEQKKKKKKKRLIILAVIAVFIIVISVSASTGGDSSNNTNTPSANAPSANSSEISADKNETVKGQIGDYICTVKNAKLCKDWEGKDSVKITYSFTNNDDDPKSFDIALDDNVYQDGIGLESTFISSDDDDWGIDVKIKPGTTKDVVKVYQLRDTKTDLEVEIGEWISFDDTKITTTVKIAK